jgi:hypothetical protein
MDQVLPPACSVLLEESCSVAIDAMGKGEKQIPLFNLQQFVLEQDTQVFGNSLGADTTKSLIPKKLKHKSS